MDRRIKEMIRGTTMPKMPSPLRGKRQAGVADAQAHIVRGGSRRPPPRERQEYVGSFEYGECDFTSSPHECYEVLATVISAI